MLVVPRLLLIGRIRGTARLEKIILRVSFTMIIIVMTVTAVAVVVLALPLIGCLDSGAPAQQVAETNEVHAVAIRDEHRMLVVALQTHPISPAEVQQAFGRRGGSVGGGGGVEVEGRGGGLVGTGRVEALPRAH